MQIDSVSSHAPLNDDPDAVEVKQVSNGLGAWVIAVPLALIFTVGIIVGFDLNLLWSIPVYILSGSSFGVIFTLLAMFRR